MNKVSNVCGLMTVSARQRDATLRRADPAGWPLPDCDDGATYALNVEEGAGGALLTACGAKAVADTVGRPLMADRQGGETYVYTVDSHNAISRFRLPASLEEGTSTAAVCTLPQAPRKMVRCGDFLVTLLADGALHYMTVNPGTHAVRPLGGVPSAPSVRVRVCGVRTFSAMTPPVTFSAPVADMRGGVPADVLSKLRAAAQTAAGELEALVRGAGLWSAPVCVRVAVRLRDGALLSVSEPFVVGAGVGLQASAPLFLLTGAAGSGFTGAGSAEMAATAFGIEVEVSGMPASSWRGLVSALEVWVTPQPVKTPGFATAQGGAFTNGSQHGVRLSAPAVVSTPVSRLVLQPQLLSASLAAFDTTARLVRDETARAGEPRLEPTARRDVRAAVIAAHDSFLHLADIRRPVAPPPLPSDLWREGEEAETVFCITTVDLRPASGAAGGMLSARATGVLRSRRLAPLLWYPSATAERMRVSLRLSDGTVLENTFPLTPASDGSDAAFYTGEDAELTGFSEVPAADTSLAGDDCEREAGCVMTMARGNPMVEADTTRCADGAVGALCAQPSGGGAYTRQYIYAFGDGGVTALLHDAAGRHVNARTVSHATGVAPDAVAPTPDGVFILARGGELLRLRDAKADTIVRGLTEYSRLAWHRASNRLWLMPGADSGGRSLAFELTPGIAGRRASLVSLVPGTPLMADGSFLTASPSGAMWRLYRFGDGETPGAPQLAATWISPDIAPGFHGPALLNLGITSEAGHAVSVVVAGLEPWLPDPVCTLASTLCRGTVGEERTAARNVAIPILLPRRLDVGDEARLRISVAGKWERLISWSLTPLPVP